MNKKIKTNNTNEMIGVDSLNERHITQELIKTTSVYDNSTYLNKLTNIDAEIALSKLETESIEMILTEPPKQIDFDYLSELYRVLEPTGHMYIICKAHELNKHMTEAIKVGFKIANVLVWKKNNVIVNRYYSNNAEFIIFFRKATERAKSINLIASPTVLQFNNIKKGLKIHKDEKPVDLIEHLILNSSSEQGIVLDPFAGSASVALACLNVNRQFICFENDINAFTKAENRLKKHPKLKSVSLTIKSEDIKLWVENRLNKHLLLPEPKFIDTVTNKITFGDSIQEIKNLPDCSIDLVVSDPPYQITKSAIDFKLDKVKASWYFNELFRVLKNDSNAYIMTNATHLHEFLNEAEKAGFKLQNLLVWEKQNKVPNSYYMRNNEFTLFLTKGKPKTIINTNSKQLHKFYNKVGHDNKLHPTEKPLDLMRLYIENSSSVGDLILDPFAGSGTTAVACIETGRNFITFELDEEYFDVAIKRISEAG